MSHKIDKVASVLKAIACVGILIGVATSSESTTTAQFNSTNPAYVSAHERVLIVARHNDSQFCVRMATLTIMGRWDIAQQYDEDFGVCSRKLVKRMMGL